MSAYDNDPRVDFFAGQRMVMVDGVKHWVTYDLVTGEWTAWFGDNRTTPVQDSRDAYGNLITGRTSDEVIRALIGAPQ